jgi:hypothetical protein
LNLCNQTATNQKEKCYKISNDYICIKLFKYMFSFVKYNSEKGVKMINLYEYIILNGYTQSNC